MAHEPLSLFNLSGFKRCVTTLLTACVDEKLEESAQYGLRNELELLHPSTSKGVLQLPSSSFHLTKPLRMRIMLDDPVRPMDRLYLRKRASWNAAEEEVRNPAACENGLV
nr:hypothetical protein Iba_chr11eCG13880 [Ipomoea batatas]